MKLKHSLALAAALGTIASAAPVITATVDRADALYKCGETATFTISIADDAKAPLPPKATLLYTQDGGKTLMRKELDLSKQTSDTYQGTLDKPGFIRGQVTIKTTDENGKEKTITKRVGAAFDPKSIQAAAPEPADFLSFWQNAVKKADETIPLDPQLTKLDKLSDTHHTSYKVSFAAPGGRVYGFLCVPTAPGKYPALVSVPGAGPGVSGPSIDNKMVTLSMNVHPYDPMTEGKTIRDLYKELNAQGTYMYHGGTDMEKTFFYRPIVGIVRALNWLEKRPEVNPQRIGYTGSSQGGAFGFILGGLYGKFYAQVGNVPAMCDHLAEKAERQAGWPGFYRNFKRTPEAEKMVPYYDAANFARHINNPIRIVVGFIDTTCCPSSVYAAFNALPAKDKEITYVVDMGHECRAPYNDYNKWLKETLLAK